MYFVFFAQNTKYKHINMYFKYKYIFKMYLKCKIQICILNMYFKYLYLKYYPALPIGLFQCTFHTFIIPFIVVSVCSCTVSSCQVQMNLKSEHVMVVISQLVFNFDIAN